MKNILYILFTVCLFTACSSDDDNTDPEIPQNYTSFVVACETDAQVVKNCVLGYRGEDKIWIRVASLGDINGKKESKEITVDYAKTKDLTLFFDIYQDGVYSKTFADDNKYTLTENKKNKFIIASMFSSHEVNKEKADQYPQ